MPIQILDNFDLGTTKPLDNRFVVGLSSFYQTKEQIAYKYTGLRIWDSNLSLPFVWTGTTWSNENSGSVIVTGGAGGYLPKFTGGVPSNVQTISQIYELVSGVNTFTGIGTSLPTTKLQVAGTITGTLFSGNGSSLTNLNASNITTGILTLDKIQNGAAGSLLVAGATPNWQSSGTIRVGSVNGLVITTDTSTNATFDLLFSRVSDVYADLLTPNSYQVKSSQGGTKRIQFNPNSGQLLFGSPANTSDGTAALPILSFVNDTNTGIYRSGADSISISAGGTGVLTVNGPTSEQVMALTKPSGNMHFDLLSTASSTTIIRLRHEPGTAYGNNDFVLQSLYAQLSGTLTAPVQRLRITNSNMVIGPDVAGSAYIRMSGSGPLGFTTLLGLRPTYTFWGSDSVGMGITSNILYFSGVNNLRVLDVAGATSPTSGANSIRIYSPNDINTHFEIQKWNTINNAGKTNFVSSNTAHVNFVGPSEGNFDRFNVKSSSIILGLVTDTYVANVIVKDSFSIEGNYFTINSTYATGGFRSTTNISGVGPDGVWTKIENSRFNFNTTYGLLGGNSVPQFSLKTNTSLYNNLSSGTYKTVTINSNNDLESITQPLPIALQITWNDITPPASGGTLALTTNVESYFFNTSLSNQLSYQIPRNGKYKITLRVACQITGASSFYFRLRGYYSGLLGQPIYNYTLLDAFDLVTNTLTKETYTIICEGIFDLNALDIIYPTLTRTTAGAILPELRTIKMFIESVD